MRLIHRNVVSDSLMLAREEKASKAMQAESDKGN